MHSRGPGTSTFNCRKCLWTEQNVEEWTSAVANPCCKMVVQWVCGCVQWVCGCVQWVCGCVQWV